MKVLIVGGGGREHALAWKLKQDDPSIQLYAAPGNPGIAEIAQCVPISGTDIDGLLGLAAQKSVDLTVVGPEAPLSIGIVDRFRAAQLPVFGPTRAAAEIETSKAFSKSLMRRAGVPTARAETCTGLAEAREALRRFGAPVVVKASGLAAGKGVIVCQTIDEAEQAIESMLSSHSFGAAGDTILIEEFMEGEELSLFAISDGTRAVPLVPAQDHKRLLEGDRGPNTGGMGAYAPVSVAGGMIETVASSPLVSDAMERVVLPTLAAMRKEGREFAGLLYAGLMLTTEGPKVVEFNARFGDPETEAVLPIMDASPSLLEMMLRVSRGEALPGDAIVRPSACAVTTIVASGGYPEAPRTGDEITLPAIPDDVVLFHAGTKRQADGSLVTAGGRVFAVTGIAPTIAEAQRRSLETAAAIEFAGKQLRTDIGWRELARHAGAA